MSDTVYGYHNKKTHVLWGGESELMRMVSDESHPDNQGRLQMLGNDPDHGQLDWERITEKAKWNELVKLYGAEYGFEPEAANDSTSGRKAAAKAA